MSVKNQFIKNRVNNVTNHKKEINHKIAVIFLSVLMIFWTVASIASVYLVCDKFIPKQETITASADQLVINDTYFSTSSFTYGILETSFADPDPNETYNISGYYDCIPFLERLDEEYFLNFFPSFQFDFGINSNGVPFFSPFIGSYEFEGSSYIFDFYYYTNSNFSSFSNSLYFRPACVLPLSNIVREQEFTDPESDPLFITSDYQIIFANTINYYGSFFVVGCSTGFNFNPVKFSIRSITYPGYYGVSFIHYYDSNGEFLWFMTYYNAECYNFVSDRIYYFSSALTDQYNTGLVDGYQNGYNSAVNDLNDSLTDIQDQAYQRGYNVGDSAGYSRGYAQGTEDAGNYTFLSLLGSVIDAPVQAITGLFNFEFLGINMLDFFFGVLTLMLVIFVVRLCLGG